MQNNKNNKKRFMYSGNHALPEPKIGRFWAHIVNPFLGRKKIKTGAHNLLGCLSIRFPFFFLNGHGGHTTAIFAGVQPPHI